MKRTFILAHSQARVNAISAVRDAPDGWAVTVGDPTRNIDQNARLWASLAEISKQVDWYGKKLSPDDWKIVFSASLKKLDVVPNIDGTGFVALGMSTSKLSKREFSDLLEIIYAFGASRSVVFSDVFN
jgi:NinB protein